MVGVEATEHLWLLPEPLLTVWVEVKVSLIGEVLFLEGGDVEEMMVVDGHE